MASESSSAESTSSIRAPLTPRRPRIAEKKAYLLSVRLNICWWGRWPGALTGSDSNSIQLGHSDCSFSPQGPSDASNRSSGMSKLSGAAFRFWFRRFSVETGEVVDGTTSGSAGSLWSDGRLRARPERRRGRGELLLPFSTPVSPPGAAGSWDVAAGPWSAVVGPWWRASMPSGGGDPMESGCGGGRERRRGSKSQEMEWMDFYLGCVGDGGRVLCRLVSRRVHMRRITQSDKA